MPDQPPDRRRSVRISQSGMVVLVTAGTPTQQVSGVLVDESGHGFRVRHPYSGFQSGEKVNFIHRCREGVARVIWNRPLNSEFETGFAYS